MKIEFTHDIIAKKVWERLPEEERQLKLVAASLNQRLEDYKKGTGSLLGLKELVAWEDYFPVLAREGALKKFVEGSRLEVEAQQEKERIINRRLRSRLTAIYFIAGALFLLAIFFFIQARTISFQKKQIEADAQKATQLRTAFGADDRGYFIEEGIKKFESSQFQEAIYDFALARFLSPLADTALTSSWIDRAQKGLEAEQLFQAGQWDRTQQLTDEISDSNARPSALIQRLKEAENIWQEAINDRPLNTILRLDLSERQLHAIPETIGQLVNLEQLYLNNNHLNTLPPSIGQLSNLRDLVINGNDLDSLPPSLSRLTALEFLELSHNELEKLPDSFGQLNSLRKLNARHNRIDTLPSSIGNLNSLTELDMSHNKLKKIPSELTKLKALEKLILGRNAINSLPEEFGDFPALEELDLDSNLIVVLPPSFSQMQQLEILHLSHNRLRELPNNFGELQSLKNLFLDHNQMESLPLSFGQLVRLSSAYLQSNRISAFSEELLDNLPGALIFIDLTGNELSDSIRIMIRNRIAAGTNILTD